MAQQSSFLPAADPVYLYTMSPTLFVAGTTASFTLTITNTAVTDEVSALRAKRSRAAPAVRAGKLAVTGDVIQVDLPQGDPGSQNVLVPASDASLINPQVTASPSGQPWTSILSLTAQGYQVRIWPIGGGSLGAGQSVTVQVSNVVVTPTPNAPLVRITETVLGSQPATMTIHTLVTSASLDIVANAVPATVGLGQPTVLQWSAMGGSTVTITGTTTVEIPLSGPGPIYSGSRAMLPFQDARQTTFTLTVSTQDNQTRSYPVTVTLSPPVVRTFSYAPPGPFDLDDSVTFWWDVDYATQVFFTPVLPPGTGQVVPTGSQTVVPRKLYPQASNQSTLTFTLTTKGYQPPGEPLPAPTLTLELNPAQILYFRYSNLQSKAIQLKVANGRPMLTGPDSTGLSRLQVTGPAGPLEQFLGPGPYLEIQYFSASPNPSPAPGTSVELTWLTQNATSLVLDPGNIPVTSNAQGSGSATVAPTADTTYILTATAQPAGTEVTSQLDITVQGAATARPVKEEP